MRQQLKFLQEVRLQERDDFRGELPVPAPITQRRAVGLLKRTLHAREAAFEVGDELQDQQSEQVDSFHFMLPVEEVRLGGLDSQPHARKRPVQLSLDDASSTFDALHPSRERDGHADYSTHGNQFAKVRYENHAAMTDELRLYYSTWTSNSASPHGV